MRAYQIGDDLRRIHWPVTAHRGELTVRQEGSSPIRSATLVLDDVFTAGETINLAELAEQNSILTFCPIDASDMTNDEIYDAALLAMTYKGDDAPDVAALCQAAINRRAAASKSENAFESCGEIRIN